MGFSTRLFRLPRPQRFLYTMSLSTGASLITLSLLLNKLSGFYGILALFTGYHLSPIQISMYIYSMLALFLTLYLSPHIRTQSPLHCLALAWFYALDSIVNAAYTAAFAITWFLVLAQHNAGGNAGDVNSPGAGTIDDTSGFTSPKYNVSNVEIVPPSAAANQDATAIGQSASFPAGTSGSGTISEAILSTDSINSIGVIIALWTIRMYFCVIMLAYARFVLRQHIALSSAKPRTTDYTTASTSSELAENPFSQSKPEGQGWRGKLGRAMLSIGQTYWLGSDEDDSWMSNMGRKLNRSGEVGSSLHKAGPPGPAERERRRRSGTGPPDPSPQLVQGQKTLGVPGQNL